jgi:hypothetical protein
VPATGVKIHELGAATVEFRLEICLVGDQLRQNPGLFGGVLGFLIFGFHAA